MPWKARASCEEEDVLGRAAGDRADHEERRTDHEDPAAAVEVGQRPGGEQQRGQAQRVGVDHPLQVGEAGVELVLDVGQRDVHDRDVEQQDEDAEADRDQGPPLRVAAGGRVGVAAVAVGSVMSASPGSIVVNHRIINYLTITFCTILATADPSSA